jgi:hypothetical protein
VPILPTKTIFHIFTAVGGNCANIQTHVTSPIYEASAHYNSQFITLDSPKIATNINHCTKMLAISFEHASRLPPPVRFMRRENKKNPESTGNAVADAEPWRQPVNDLEARLRQRETSRYRGHYNRIVGMEIQQEFNRLLNPLHNLEFDLLFLLTIANMERRHKHNTAG